MADDFLKEIIAQAFRLRRLENSAAKETVDDLDGFLQLGLDAETVAEIAAYFAAKTTAFYLSLAESAKDRSIRIAFNESHKTASEMSKAVGLPLSQPVTVRRLRGIYDGDAIEGLTADEWFAHNSRQLKARVELQSKLSRELNESPDELKQRLEDNVFQKARRDAEALQRTTAANLTNAAIWETGEINPGLTKGYRLIVTFDRRTSQICMAYGARNKVYPYAPESPRPPLHFMCRTIIEPVLIGRENEKPIDAEEWLKKQSAETQNEILGERRAELFRRGRIDLSDLIRSDNTLATIPELLGVASVVNP